MQPAPGQRNSDTATEVAVVGGGVIGCAVAYYLSARGKKVTIIEAGTVGCGASSANPGSIALSTKKPGRTLSLAIASRILFQDLSEELGQDLEFAVDGNLIFAETDEEMQLLGELCAAQQKADVPARLIDATECRRINPLLDNSIPGGLYCAADAHTNPFVLTAAFARSAVKRGAEIRTGSPVSDIAHAHDGQFDVVTASGTIRCDWLVNAAGVAAPRIGKMLGLVHNVIPRKGEIVVLEATPDLPLARTSAARQLMIKHSSQAQNNTVALSYTRKPRSNTVLLGSTNELGQDSIVSTREAIVNICAYARRVMPHLAHLHVVRSWAGLRPYSPSGPLLGHCKDGPPKYLLAAGHGGDGTALAPVTGRYIAELISAHPERVGVEEFLAAAGWNARQLRVA
jgi:sarcosine oxidase subunit beta